MYASLDFIFIYLCIITTILFGISIYLICIRPYSMFKKLGIPGPKPWPFLGNFYNFSEIVETDLERKLIEKHGNVFGLYEGRKPVLFVADLDLIKNIFIKDFQYFTDRRHFELIGEFTNGNVADLKGNEWKAVRNIITPVFSTGKMKNIFHIMNDCSNILREELKEISEQNKTIDIKNYLSGFVLDVIAKSSFGIDLNSIKDKDNPFVQHANKISNGTLITLPVILELLVPSLVPIMKFLGISIVPKDTQDFFKKNLNTVIKMRKEQNSGEKDLLQLLLNTQKNPVENKDDKTKRESKDNYEKKSLTDEDVLVQCIIFLLAGTETTSSVLSFCCDILARNPEWQDKIVEEMQTVLNNDADIHYEDLSKLQILDNVVMETLRLYSPALRTERECTMDYNLNGKIIPKGTLIVVPIYTIHHDKEIWPEPEKFNPERFSPANSTGRHSMSFLAFGSGPRNCIGMRFALMEIKLVLAKILYNFTIILASDEKLKFRVSTLGILTAKNGVWIRLEKRTK